MKRFDPVVAAKQFIDKHFSNCQGALLAGSVVRERQQKLLILILSFLIKDLLHHIESLCLTLDGQ